MWIQFAQMLLVLLVFGFGVSIVAAIQFIVFCFTQKLYNNPDKRVITRIDYASNKRRKK